MIIENIVKEGLNRIVVAACSPSLHEPTFRQSLLRAGLNPFLFEYVNIRGQVSWVSKSDPEGATAKAIRLVAASVAQVRLSRPLEPIRVDAARRVVIIGGGVSGLHCARDLLLRGFPVVLLERSPVLGARVAELHRVFPVQVCARDLLTWGEEVEAPADLVVLVTGAVSRYVSRLADMLKQSRSPDGFL